MTEYEKKGNKSKYFKSTITLSLLNSLWAWILGLLRTNGTSGKPNVKKPGLKDK